ncbi:testis-expressed protein 48 isoform X5 [Tamandua tetradactyla]|uniref:testis-expressed protein 48 isoform X5 n=1 Tax=Tamandua tetradactyla TaxID=48850 RepID=UPI004053DB4A
MAAHQTLASKIFCICCRNCEEPYEINASKIPSQTQEHQPSTCDLTLQQDELNRQSSKHTKAASSLPVGQPLVHPEKKVSTSSSEFEGNSPAQRTVLNPKISEFNKAPLQI